jgi:methionyl-tRNA formyltransferase
MTIVFMGTPDFAVPSLRALAADGHTIAAVVTAPDRARGRGQRVSATPVKEEALRLDLPLLQPATLRDPVFVEALRVLQADVFVVVAFRILPPEVFTLPLLGAFNLHASLLPRYRGAAPINWALINGDTETGVTTFFLREKVDTGGMILQRRIAVGPDATAGELHDALMILGAETVVDTVRSIARGEAPALEQDDTLATPAPKIFRADCAIDWSDPARRVHDRIRGLSPHPAAWTLHGAAQLKLYRTRVSDIVASGPAGTVSVPDGRLAVMCGDGALEVLELQQEGRRVMTAAEFLRGYSFAPGDRLMSVQ